MKIKINIGWVKIGGVLLALSLMAPIGAQGRKLVRSEQAWRLD